HLHFHRGCGVQFGDPGEWNDIVHSRGRKIARKRSISDAGQLLDLLFKRCGTSAKQGYVVDNENMVTVIAEVFVMDIIELSVDGQGSDDQEYRHGELTDHQSIAQTGVPEPSS